MSEEETLAAIGIGAAAVDGDADTLILGEMGIGNSTVAAALAAAFFGGKPEDWVGASTASDAGGIARKCAAVERGLALHRGLDAFDTHSRLDGREQAAICGSVLAARTFRIPVILDGFICTAAASTLHVANRSLLDHCLMGHGSAEPGHRRPPNVLGKRPVLEPEMRLGEGTGAALALGILSAALHCHNGMATFVEAGIG